MTVTTINEWSAVWATLLWKASWQGGVALLLMLAFSRAWRSIPAPIQCWLWRLAFLKLLIAGVWIVPWELRWLPPVETAMSASPPISAAEAHALEPFPADQHALPPSLAIPRPLPVWQFSLSSWLLIAWLAGVIFFIARLIKQWALVRKAVSNLVEVTDDQARQSVVSSCRKMRLRQRPQLRVSKNSGSPCLIGLIRPIIVIPSVVLESCSAEVVNAAVIHELAHVKRHDLFWNWLPALAEALFFFHPLVWLAKREWRMAQEMAADRLAVSVGRCDVANYVGSLLELVAKCRTTSLHAHLAVGVSETYSQLRRRIVAMQSLQVLTPPSRLAPILVLAVAVCGVAPWKLTSQETQARSIASAAPTETADDAQTPTPSKKSPAAVIAEIQNLGCEIIFDDKIPGRPVISVNCFNTNVGDASLAQLKVLTSLRALTLDGTNVTDAGLAHLAVLTSLQALDLNSTRVTNDGLAHLKGLTRLEQLGLIKTRVTNSGLAHLKGLTRLVMLLLSDNKITDEGLVNLKGLTRLQTLMLDGTKITDAGLKHLQGLTSLQDLRLNETDITDAGLEYLKGLTHLQTLVLNGTKITGEGLIQLKELPNLQSLWLSNTRITDAGLENVKRLTRLKTLVIGGSKVSDARKKKLEQEMPACKITWSGPENTVNEKKK